jgi:acetylornithine deacetylase/succinyl-diaminopimelate desuccinylase-like protein
MRLVPDQDPQETFELFKGHVLSLAPRGIQLEVRHLSSAEPVVVSTDNRFVQAAAEAMRGVFGKDTVFVRSGGSIPIVASFERFLGVPSLLMGFGLPDCGAHGPNEKLSIRCFHEGVESLVRFFELLGSDVE